MHNHHFELLSGVAKYFSTQINIYSLPSFKFPLPFKPKVVDNNFIKPISAASLKKIVVEIAQYLHFQDSFAVYSFFHYSINKFSSKSELFLSSAKLNKCKKGLPKEIVLFTYKIELMEDHKKIIHRVLDNEAFFNENFLNFSTLTKREKNIIQLLTKGLSSKVIAMEINISVHTVNTHRKNINNKLGTQNINSLLRFSEVFDLN